jgi:uncharacterized protein (TIGR02646 family)
MHWVNRGKEPPGLKHVRKVYTRGWVIFYRHNKGKKPSDEKWREFHHALLGRFSCLCGYCECETKGEVDHFRPKKHFPEGVYEWSNWVLACHDCNNSKGQEWPCFGFVDPCAEKRSERPERYFCLDLNTGEILPLASLNPQRRRRALDTIRQLKLNAFHQLKRRTTWIVCLSKAIEGRRKKPRELRVFLRKVTKRGC